MKIIRMVRTEMEAPGNIDFVRWGDIYPSRHLRGACSNLLGPMPRLHRRPARIP